MQCEQRPRPMMEAQERVSVRGWDWEGEAPAEPQQPILAVWSLRLSGNLALPAGRMLAWFVIIGCLAYPAQADETARRWIRTGALSAAEAHQAAAADERFVYAIANTVIGKYDRRTGERLATSTGAAKHLNSGFLWNGRLYCAHSNYPRTPEESEIKVLDPDTMRLTTLKDFGNFGGSLTWAVRHDGHWWCNFARYGDANGETFLVKFDDQWRERGRWIYPPELVGKLGRYSLSGGLWRDGALLVTDHDHPVLYRLRVPQDGNVLEFVETQPAPFSGQGFAYDPTTGGFVGIHRGKRQVVFAVPQEPDIADR